MRNLKTQTWGLAALSMVLCTFAASFAAPPKEKEPVARQTPTTAGPVIRASTIAGMTVKNAAGKDLGKVEDVVVDMGTGQIRYAAISFGGFLGIGDKLFAVPMRALRLDTEAEQFVLDADKESLKNAPGFDKDHWPNTADPGWRSTVDSYYKV
jgi:sporulation protein YlmC with PRC-barrel domain